MHFSLFHLDFLYIAVSWVLLRWHQLFSLFMDPDSGLTWALSIVMLVVTARVLLFRMFIKQVHFQRRMQEMAPRFNEIKKKYPNDRAAQQRETMELQRSEGFNPLAGCLPMFLQIPVFLGLYHVLRHLADSASAADRVGNQIGPGTIKQLTMYGFSRNETISGAKAKLFGAPLAGSFRDGAAQLSKLGGDPTTMRLVVLPLLLISAGATFATQLLSRANQTVAPTGTNASLQKVFLYVFPLGVLASGLIFNFPLGVLLYWFTSNTWTLAQQAYIIRFHPPTTPVSTGPTAATAKAVAPRPGQRPDRSRPAKSTPAKPAPNGTSNGSGNGTAKGPSDSVDESAAVAESPVSSGSGADVAPSTPAPARPPRSGPRPNRPSSNRAPAKRPSQAKKRR